MEKVKLDQRHYHDFLNGIEVECLVTKASQQNLHPGEHIMVYKDTFATTVDVAPPTREKLSDNIGVEGTITEINRAAAAGVNGINAPQRFKMKKL